MIANRKKLCDRLIMIVKTNADYRKIGFPIIVKTSIVTYNNCYINMAILNYVFLSYNELELLNVS